MHPGWRRWATVFCHPATLMTIGLIVLHQSVIASSSFFLTRLIELFQEGGRYEKYLYLYLAAMLTPYVPGCISFISLKHWINSAHRRFTDELAHAAYGRTVKFRNGALRENVEAIISRNAFITIKEYLTFVHGFLGFVLNSGLSMLVLGILLPGNLLLGYLISVILCAVFILAVNKAISIRSREVENRFISYSDNLAAIWENAIIGNKHNFRHWSASKCHLGDRYYKASSNLEAFMQHGNLILAAAALGPTIYLVIKAAEENAAQPALVAAIIVNLTRVFHILNSLSSLLSQLLEWPSMNARLKVMFSAEQLLRADSKTVAKPLSAMTINGQLIEDYEDVVRDLVSVPNGRFTIRGGNGSGKSTLLLVVKQYFGEAAMMLPAHHGRLSWRSNDSKLSTGQRTVLQIREMLSTNDVHYFLFDEWDANLDQDNTDEIEQLLEEKSSKHVVVEIRH